ncbi:hypothetical protein JRO89_XS03G0069900 [Xanthoceras sorbifolium]|uniref:GDT1 family protein n=1 Tax=Xanthoceras sorbifolium TaxID=99658 RepID=A0ABQ8I912_9ROSI|nr:hypothetical protein JRO89_XS03G0069900 [Xanthoceras sorbifolium]
MFTKFTHLQVLSFGRNRSIFGWWVDSCAVIFLVKHFESEELYIFDREEISSAFWNFSVHKSELLFEGELGVLLGSMGALALMTVLSVVIGIMFHSVPAQFQTTLPIGEYAAVTLLMFFGLKSIKDAWDLPPSVAKSGDKSGPGLDEFVEAEELVKEKVSKRLSNPLEIVWKSFSLVFFAEWGDRSMLATIALGAAQSPLGVASGAIAGHLLATSIAVLGGAFLASYISEKVVGYTGGVLFLVFAAATFLGYQSRYQVDSRRSRRKPILLTRNDSRRLLATRTAATPGGVPLPPLDLTEDNVRQVLADARVEASMTGEAELAELDGPFVKISLRGRFWHKRSTVLARLANYLKQRIPEILEVDIEDEKQLDDSPENF